MRVHSEPLLLHGKKAKIINQQANSKIELKSYMDDHRRIENNYFKTNASTYKTFLQTNLQKESDTQKEKDKANCLQKDWKDLMAEAP